jgi:hypothetical protein
MLSSAGALLLFAFAFAVLSCAERPAVAPEFIELCPLRD